MSNKPLHICPSVLASDMSKLLDETIRVIDAGADCIHLDVMDGHFVPNLTFGPPIIKNLHENLTKLKKRSSTIFDCHLMVTNPAQWIPTMKEAGVEGFTYHWEVCENLEEAKKVAMEIKKHQMSPGLSINPKTPLEDAFPLLDTGLIEKVLVMTVQPGFGGQSFQDQTEKIKAIYEKYPEITIQVDGGIDVNTIGICAKAGATSFVCGTSIYKAPNIKERIDQLRVNAKLHMK